MGNKKKKILAVLLGGALLGTQIPGMVWAEGTAGYTGGICEHHPVHTAECDYQEAVPEQPCRHEHTEKCYEYVTSCVHVHTEECYPLITIEVPAGEQDTAGTAANSETAAEAGTAEDAGAAAEPQTELVRGAEPTECTHVCSEDSGCVTKTLNCVHVDKKNADGSITYAVHDASCGYAPAVEGKECTFVCEICSASEEKEIELMSLSETETEALTVQTGIAAAGSADSEPSAKTTEAETKGTEIEETDPETETTTQGTSESETKGTEIEETDPETETTTEGTSESETKGTETEETDSKTETSTEGTPESETKGTEIEETDPETETTTEETSGSDAETETDEAVPDEAVAAVQALIDALPTVEEVEQMTKDEQKEVYDKAQDAADAYFDELTEGQQAQVDLTNLMNLMNYFNGQVSTMATGYTLTDGVLEITSSAGLVSFRQNTDIKSVIIKAGVEGSIGNYAFSKCTNLTSVTIEEGATIGSIGENAFAGCSNLESITIPNSVTSIGKNAFDGCSGLTSITISEGVTSIGSYAFDGCSGLTSITIPNSVTSIGSLAFYKCSNLESITIPSGVTSISNSTFAFCSNLKSITILGNMTSIGSYAFEDCSNLESITILGNVTSIGSYAFLGCSNLESITIPNGVTSIDECIFYRCSNLNEVILPATAPTSVSEYSFYGKWDSIDFRIPVDSIGSGEGQYNLNESPWNQIKMVNGMQVDNGKFVISSVSIGMAAPQAGGYLPSASSATDGVSVSSSWNPDNTVAAYGTTYTVTVTLSVRSDNYKFADSVAVTFNNEKVEATDITEKDGTLIFTQTYQIPKQAQDSPQISIDYQNEKLNTTADMEYRTNEEEEWITCTADMKAAALGWNGTAKTVQIRLKETADAYASDPVSVSIPARPAITVSQTTGSTTASGLTVSASVSGTSAGVSPEVQYQLVADGGSIDSGKWQESGEFTNLKADTSYTAYAKCGATTSSFASDISSGLALSTVAAAYTVTIPSATLTAGDSTSKAEISVDVSDGKLFDLGYGGQVQVKVKNNGAVSSDGKLTLTRQGASDTLTSAMLVNGAAFTNITNPVAAFTMNNYTSEDAKAAVSFAQPQPTDTTQTVIPAGTYSGTVTFEVSYIE